ncbi:MAG TPA: nuclear transport factor 2 family protein [Acidimicrobiales bacterium]|nr:nuclear transport factor 2 family protein [Acidimicrobiales bacterium]
MGLTTDDVVAIQQLVARYNHAVDSGDGPAFADTFTDDGVLDAGQPIEGRDALESFAKSVGAGFPNPRHIASNIVVEGSGDQATLKAYVQMYASLGEPPSQQIMASGRYQDSLARIDGDWRFVRRTFVAD